MFKRLYDFICRKFSPRISSVCSFSGVVCVFGRPKVRGFLLPYMPNLGFDLRTVDGRVFLPWFDYSLEPLEGSEAHGAHLVFHYGSEPLAGETLVYTGFYRG